MARALPVALALAACGAPRPPSSPTTVSAAEDARRNGAAALVAGPGSVYAREREGQMRGVGVPPALPPPGAIDRLPGTLRASRPAPGTGPATAAPLTSLPVPSNALSPLSALPASPLANPPGGFGGFGGLGRP